MIIRADARHIPLADESVQAVVTSPPYWGLRDYGIAPSIWGGREDCAHEWGKPIPLRGKSNFDTFDDYRTDGTIRGGQGKMFAGLDGNHGNTCLHCSAWRGVLGLEPTPELYVQHIVEIFRQVKRVLRKDGTCWVNLGDSYNAYNGNAGPGSGFSRGAACDTERPHLPSGHGLRTPTLKPKDLVGIPWRVAFALQADGWWLRTDGIEEVELYCPCGCGHVMEERVWRYPQDREIIWSKPNPMPESVTDRPTKSHEYIFLLSKSEQYYYDAEAIKEPGSEKTILDPKPFGRKAMLNGYGTGNMAPGVLYETSTRRNKRSVWTVATQPYPEAHFATFPEDLIKPCILAGTSSRGACVDCGASWERVMELGEVQSTGGSSNGMRAKIEWRGEVTPEKQNHSMFTGNMKQHSHKTLFWQPSCRCDERKPFARLLETSPCIVLDPFSGSGTTVKVAQDLGRIGIGLDLKTEYLKMAKHRSAQLGLFT